MCFGQVGYVNVVPDGCTVRCRVVRSVNLHRTPLPERGLDDTWDQMGFGMMLLTDLPFGISPGRIEVAQGRPFESVSLGVPVQSSMDEKLGFCVGSHCKLKMSLGNGGLLRNAIGGAGGG